jgi:two-component system, chemotaxis family, CheB/CheR fusion protein
LALKNSKNSKTVSKARNQKKAATKSTRNNGLTVVGIGASAGGLKALQSFFDALPNDTNMAYVVITHLHPEYVSHLPEILQSHTQMPVTQVKQLVAVEPDHVYVIPPNRRMVMADSKLDIAEFDEPRGHRAPIDLFFRSLASSHPDSAAIVLSGSGTDGAVGIKAVKESGGLLMVQHPNEAEYDSMPRAAIATGLADVVLPAAQLAEKLVHYTRNRTQLPQDENELSTEEMETIQRILAQVHARTGHDFSQYKRSTILRRIQRRMQLNGFTTLEAYLGYLRLNVPEATAMFNDILIGVTNFFRDAEAWKTLSEKVIPKLFEDKEIGDRIRGWSIGCATGEEAYSLAILFFEHAAKMEIRPKIQVFASDLDENSILWARDGLYPAAIEADVSPERLERFFTREGDHYRVTREVRDAVLFTNHNVLRDPPFSHQDIISCRNLLIYLQRPLQDNVFNIFHYALRPGGYLFLGNSESAEGLHELFEVIDKSYRLYRAKPWTTERPHMPAMPLTLRRTDRSGPHASGLPYTLARYMDEPSVLDEKHRKAIETYGPPSILIDENYAILHISETAGRYLLQPKGPITSDLIKLVRPELQLELRTALFQAFEKKKASFSQPVPVQFNGHPQRVLISVHPRLEASAQGGDPVKQVLVVFLEDELDEQAEHPITVDAIESDERKDNKLVARLEAEIMRLREQLQLTIEEYESSNEEMKAANEELQSINEEYRSATEELETSKEELQSINEELQTVNAEMKGKLDEISRGKDEMQNLLGAMEIPTLFLDRELTIQRYTPSMQELFNIRPVDHGRPITHLTNRLLYHEFSRDAEQVLRDLMPIEREVQAEHGNWYMVRLRPYRTAEDRIEGLVIAFVDITKLKAAEQTQREMAEKLEERVRSRTRELDDTNRRLSQARDLFSKLFHVNPIPTSISRLENGSFIDVNEAYLDFCGLAREDIINHTSEEVKLPLAPEISPGLIARLQKEGVIRNLQLDITLPSGEAKTILASLQNLNFGGADAVMLAFNDITERVRIEREVRTVASNLTSADQIERSRIARILHDDLQQNIFAVKMQLSLMRDAMEKDEETSKVDLAQLDELLANAIATIRQLSVDLSPPILQGEGLTEAVIGLSTQMKEQYDLDVTVHTNDVHAVFDENVRLLVFQAIRELLFNVVKHSETSKATVTFKQMDGEVGITIGDDGKGFETEKVMENWKARHGLLRMRDRLFLLGCNLKIKSKPGDGTRVTIEAPTKSL